MPRLEIALFGSPEIKIDNNSAQTDRRKAIALLAYLAVTGKAHSRDHLTGLLWPDYERDSAYAYLRRTLWELNQILGKDWIDADREAVRITDGADLQLDTIDFEDAKKRFETDGEAAHLETAIVLYRGDFMSGFVVADTAPFEEWQNQQAEYFRREFARALESLVETRTNIREYESALPYARRWLALDQLNESAHRAIMRILAGMGDRTGAIRQYEACAKTLKDELGISPQSETEELYQGILSGDIFGRQKKTDEARQTAPRPVSRLPQMPTPFIGRRPEVEQVKLLINDPNHRVITMIGPGGTGKTRLSIQAASEMDDKFSDGVFFTPLASVQTAEAVLPAIAKAIDFSFYQEEESRQKQLLDYLREKQLLLVLDNFEHVTEAASLVNDILVNAANIKLVVTSRTRLNVRGEQLYTVTGMRTPVIDDASSWDDPEEQAKPFSGVQLFLDCARRVHANFSLTKVNLVPVLEICNLVQGMPLALELSAAWLELLSPQEIVEEIRRSLDFLETDQTGVPERQRSIRAVFESSWKLLSEGERDIFLKLCVFVGSFSRGAAQEISGASLKTLLGLANKSWLQHTEDGRFQLHELMRQYGEERLREDETAWRAAKNSHADFFVDYVAKQAIKLTGSEQLAGLEAMELEFESNIKSAFDWLVAERRWSDLIERMVLLGLFQFSLIRWRVSEMATWYREAWLAFTTTEPQGGQVEFATLCTLELFYKAANWDKQTDSEERFNELYQLITENDLDESMGFCFSIVVGLAKFWNIDIDLDERFERHITRLREANHLWELGYILGLQGGWWQDHGFDEEKLKEALQLFKQIGAISEASGMYQKLGRHAFQQKRPIAEIMDYYDEAMKLSEQLGNDPYAGINLQDLVDIYIQQGEIEKGFELLHRAQRYFEEKGNIQQLINYLNWEGLHAVRYSTHEHALGVRQRGLTLARKKNRSIELSWQLLEIGDVYRISGDIAKAYEAYDEAMPIFESISEYLGLGYRHRGLGDIALQERDYEDALKHYGEYLQFAIKRNHLWSIGQAHGKLALAHAYLGDVSASRAELQQSLNDLQSWPENQLYVLILLAEPVCLIHENKYEQAIELVALIASHPASWYETKQLANAILETASRDLPDKVVQSAIERGKALELESVIEELIGRPTD